MKPSIRDPRTFSARRTNTVRRASRLFSRGCLLQFSTSGAVRVRVLMSTYSAHRAAAKIVKGKKKSNKGGGKWTEKLRWPVDTGGDDGRYKTRRHSRRLDEITEPHPAQREVSRDARGAREISVIAPPPRPRAVTSEQRDRRQFGRLCTRRAPSPLLPSSRDAHTSLYDVVGTRRHEVSTTRVRGGARGEPNDG